jgi:hypothetical protein
MAQIGHTDPTFTLRLCTLQMLDQEGERDRLRALVDGSESAPLGHRIGHQYRQRHDKKNIEAKAWHLDLALHQGTRDTRPIGLIWLYGVVCSAF